MQYTKWTGCKFGVGVPILHSIEKGLQPFWGLLGCTAFNNLIIKNNNSNNKNESLDSLTPQANRKKHSEILENFESAQTRSTNLWITWSHPAGKI